jgi:hypothetical protein
MKTKQAVSVAVAAMLKERKSLAFDANLARNFGAKNPAQTNALKRHQQLTEAIRVLLALIVLLFVTLACSMTSMIVTSPVTDPQPADVSPSLAVLQSDPATLEVAIGAAGPELLVVCSDALHVRSSASAESAVLATLARGQVLRVYLWSAGWAYLGYGRWVNGVYLCRPSP